MNREIDLDRMSTDELRERIRTGDRDVIAAFVLKHGPVIRRRAAGRLGTRMRRLFDSQEILSTVLRRMDDYIKRGNLTVESEAQLMKLMLQMTTAAVIDKARISERLGRVESPTRPETGHADQGEIADEAECAMMERAFRALDRDVDRDILWLWLSDVPQAVMADLLGESPDFVRKRWQRIRHRLRIEGTLVNPE
ncbi:MAG: hypothetical protein KDA21_11360 [Phycisphaerales bacterium]|nr:hypothetical protein [Phycisphaerales bacterium]